MNAALLDCEEFELLDQLTPRRRAPHRAARDRSSNDRMATRARYRRAGQGAASFNGAHRRREKRNYL